MSRSGGPVGLGWLPFWMRPWFLGQGVALAVLAAVLTAVLTAVASSSPLFIQSAGEGAWRQDRERLSEVVLGATVSTGNIVRSDGRLTVPERVGRVPALDAAIRDEGVDLGLEPPLALTALFDPVGSEGPAGGASVQVISRDGADAALRILAGAPAPDGALVPASAAKVLGVGPGSSLVLRTESGAAEVVVAGVYEDRSSPSACACATSGSTPGSLSTAGTCGSRAPTRTAGSRSRAWHRPTRPPAAALPAADRIWRPGPDRRRVGGGRGRPDAPHRDRAAR